MRPNSQELPFPESDPFDYDQTVVQLRVQPFVVQDELGTIVTVPIETHPRLVPPPSGDVFVDEDPFARLERKLDAAMRQIAALQTQLDSLDLTLARALTR